MACGIFVFFAPQQENLIRSIWELFAASNIAPRLHVSGHRPHISLAVYQQLDLARSQAVLASLAHQGSPFTITLSTLGIFPSKKPILFLAPHISDALLSLHTQVHQAFQNIGTSPFSHYLDGHWTPHCTLAKGFRSPDLHRALDIGLQISLPLTCQVEKIGIVEYPQVIHHYTYTLGTP